MPYKTHFSKDELAVTSPAFKGSVAINYLDHTADESAPSDLDPNGFKRVAPEQARYLGIKATDSAMPTPLKFGIRLRGDKSFMLEQADEIANGLLGQVAPFNKNIAVT